MNAPSDQPASPTNGSPESDRPRLIYVDLDGSLIRTNLFVEALFRLMKRNPLFLLQCIKWLFKGRAALKAYVARKVKIDAAHLPYETDLIDYLIEQKKNGRRLILATASHWTYARKVADHLGIFDAVIASSAKINLKGRNKLSKIIDAANGENFAYVGDSPADRPIWEKAASAILVNPQDSDIKSVNAQNKYEKIFARKTSVFRSFLLEMRPHQWAKNLLIFVPILTSHSYMNETTLLSAILAFVAFSLCASGVYFLNDILDMDADRRHETKRNRPLASGNLPIPYGVIGTIILPLAAFAIAGYFLSFFFIVVLAAYLVLTILYSFVLKSISTADVMTLGILYTLRVIAGAAATGIVLSSWLAAFSIFLFVSLAYLKRYIEVADIEPEQGKIRGRGYTAFDTETMFSLGIANASVSVLVFALYLNSSEVTETYSQPQLLWLLCILLLYWTNRIWVGARRGKITEDPVVFALKDRVSRMIGIAFICIVFGAKHINVEIGN